MKYTVSNYFHKMETLMKEADLNHTQSKKTLSWVLTVYITLAAMYPTEDILDSSINKRNTDAILKLSVVLLSLEKTINENRKKGGEYDDYGHIDDYLAFLKDTYNFDVILDRNIINIFNPS